ncbi:TA system VapC family ribonuclease toxin [Luteolibacter sp. Populi]|uniref:TA system VapC family ribonuclease toxin n=1 Tax=Luteolibacter sp. Populi TaxID=3230487 RepID=UPI0034677FF8
MIDLPDVNVWVALSYDGHPHHSRAQTYWQSERAEQAAFCSATMMGMLRILTLNGPMDGRPFTPRRVSEKYSQLSLLSDVGFIPDSSTVRSRIGSWAMEPFFTGKLWTDAWIAALAMENGCRVVSFDSDFGKFPGLQFLHLAP